MSKIRLLAGLGLLAVLACGVLYGIGYSPVHDKPQRPAALVTQPGAKAAPDAAFTDAKGGRHSLGDFRGHYLLLNLWATYCAPCVAELPALAKLKQAVPDLQVVAVDVGRDSPQLADAFLKAHKAGGLDTYSDTDIALIRAFRAVGLPVTLLIDPQGHIVARAEGGAAWDAPDSIAYFQTLAAGS